jgi:hypothetical protein
MKWEDKYQETAVYVDELKDKSNRFAKYKRMDIYNSIMRLSKELEFARLSSLNPELTVEIKDFEFSQIRKQIETLDTALITLSKYYSDFEFILRRLAEDFTVSEKQEVYFFLLKSFVQIMRDSLGFNNFELFDHLSSEFDKTSEALKNLRDKRREEYLIHYQDIKTLLEESVVSGNKFYMKKLGKLSPEEYIENGHRSFILQLLFLKYDIQEDVKRKELKKFRNKIHRSKEKRIASIRTITMPPV